LVNFNLSVSAAMATTNKTSWDAERSVKLLLHIIHVVQTGPMKWDEVATSFGEPGIGGNALR